MRLIDAGELIREFEKIKTNGSTEYQEGINDGIDRCTVLVANAPIVDAVPLEDFRSMERMVNKLTKAIADAEPVRHGYWEWNDNGGLFGNYHCTVCGYIPGKFPRMHCPDYMYCPKCGAKMDEEKENGRNQ